MQTPLTLTTTAEELTERFLRAGELKQAVDWGKIVDCFQRWAAEVGIKVSVIVRIETADQLKETASQAWKTRETKYPLAARAELFNMSAARSRPVAQAALKTSNGTAIWDAVTATRVWTTEDWGHALLMWILYPEKDVRNVGPSAEFNLTWMALSAIGAAAVGAPAQFFAKWYPLFEALEAGAYCFFVLADRIAVCTVPTFIGLDEQRQLHASSGPAFVWLNDIRDYYWHGVYVESYVVEQPERITLADLETEMSPKVRAAKIERFCQVRADLKTPPIAAVTSEELKERYRRACGLKQTANWAKITECLQLWAARANIGAPAIVRVQSAEQALAAATLMGEPEALKWHQMSRTASAAFDAKGVKEAIAEWNRNTVGAAYGGAQEWHVRHFRRTRKQWNDWGLSWRCYVAIGVLELGVIEEFLTWYPLFEAFEAGAFSFYITGRGIEVCTLPTVVLLDDQRRLHSNSGPAFEWLNDIREYYWHGVRVEPYVVEQPERITAADITAEQDVEVRRVKIERFGQARFLVASGAQEIHRDDYGTLYRKEVPGDEPLVMVKVVNATAEPDGSWKAYFLRVPPTMQTAREAVAWTFGKSPNDYEPTKET